MCQGYEGAGSYTLTFKPHVKVENNVMKASVECGIYFGQSTRLSISAGKVRK